MDMRLFGERLKKIRLEQNISAPELARAVNIDPSTIHRYENFSFKSIKEAKLEAIAEYLNVDKEYLTGKTDERHSLKSLESLMEKQKIEVTNVIYLTKELLKNDEVTLEGKTLNRDNIDSIIEGIELILEMVKRKSR